MHTPLRFVALAALFASFLICAVLPGTAADGSADDIARILAGIEPRVDSPLAGLTRDSDWRLHASSLDAAWKSLEARQLSKSPFDTPSCMRSASSAKIASEKDARLRTFIARC